MLGPAHIVGKLGTLEMSRKIIVEPCGFPLKPCGKSWDMISVHCVETKTEPARKKQTGLDIESSRDGILRKKILVDACACSPCFTATSV